MSSQRAAPSAAANPSRHCSTRGSRLAIAGSVRVCVTELEAHACRLSAARTTRKDTPCSQSLAAMGSIALFCTHVMSVVSCGIPYATRAAIVVVLPVPGGPWIAETLCLMDRMACSCEASHLRPALVSGSLLQPLEGLTWMY